MTANWIRFGCSRGRLARTMLSSVVAAVGVMPLTATAQVSIQQGTGVAAAPFVRQLDSIPQMPRSEQHPQALPRRVPDPAALAARQAQAAQLRFTPAAKALALPASAAPAKKPSVFTPGASVGVISTGQAACGGVRPADQAIAVGDAPIGVLQVINVCVDVFSKPGVLQPGYPKSLTTFFGLPPGTPTSDPRALYDWINHRYVVVMIQFDRFQNTTSSYWIAVSTGDNATGGYCFYNLGVQSVAPAGPGAFPLPDYPRLGQDRQAFYLASNVFNTPTTYKWEEWLVLPKAQMYACQGFGFPFFFNPTFNGHPTDTTQPVNVFNPGDDPSSEFLITSKNFFEPDPKNGLIVWSIHSPLSSPTAANVTAGTANNYSTPPLASQPGGANTIDGFDNRISGMSFFNAGSIYASVNTNGGSGAPAFLLYQVQPFVDASGNITSARMLDEIFVGNANSWWFATQQPDTAGNVTTVFNFSGSSNFASLAYMSRRASQTPGTIPDLGFILVGGQAFYGQFSWGDYTAVAPGGIASGGGPGIFPVMFFAGMWAQGDGTWGTAWGKNGFTDISQP